MKTVFVKKGKLIFIKIKNLTVYHLLIQLKEMIKKIVNKI